MAQEVERVKAVREAEAKEAEAREAATQEEAAALLPP